MNKIILFLFAASISLTACEMPDIKGLNETPKITKGMADKMDEMSARMKETNEAIRLQKLALALDMLNDPTNRSKISPIPSGLWAGGKLFAENANVEEIVDFTYLKLKELEEVVPVSGLDGDLSPVQLSQDELARVRVEKMAVLNSLMIIATYAQDEKVNEILKTYILGNHNRQETGLSFLAMRAFFIRDMILVQSFKIDNSSAKTLYNSGAMRDALAWLNKLEFISRLNLEEVGLQIQVKVEDKTGQNLIAFEEIHNDATRLQTALMWKTAVEKAHLGMKAYSEKDEGRKVNANEIAAQKNYIKQMEEKLQGWAQVLQ